jgi:t-SNARE complex subunit (syntaxin)
MNDLLLSFREKGRKKGFNFDEKQLKEENIRVNIELQNFIKSNGEAQTMINVIKSNNMILQRQKELLMNSFSSEDRNKVNAVIQQIITQNTENQSKIKKTLEENYFNFINDIDDNNNLYPQERRISKNLHGATVKNFQDAMIQFQSLESELKSINERMIIRSAEIASGKKLTDEEKKEIVMNPETAQKMIQDKLSGQAHSKLQNAVRDLEERHAEIRKLESSIMEVHKLIEELAGLVKLQGEMIDDICENIAVSKTNVTDAEENIIKAKENMISARKKRCIILIIIVVVLGVVALGIWVF